MLWCHAIVNDVGDHLMPEQSVLCSPDDLCPSGSLCPPSMWTGWLKMQEVKTTDHQNYRAWNWRTNVQGMKLQDVKMTDQIAGHENAGHENAGHENDGPKMTGYRGGMLNLYSVYSASDVRRLCALLTFVSCYFIPAFSCPAISCPANWSVNFTSVIFTSSIFTQRPHVDKLSRNLIQSLTPSPHTSYDACTVDLVC